MNDIIMHINYGEVTYDSFGRNSIEDIVKVAVNIGFDGIEFRGNLPKELSHICYEAYIDEIGRCKDKYGLKTVIMSARLDDTLTKVKEDWQKEIDEAVKRAEYANRICGTTLFNATSKVIKSPDATTPADAYEFHGSKAATEREWDDVVEVFKNVGKKVDNLGLKFAFETHMNYIHDIPEATKKLVDLIDADSIGINMDFGNTVYFPNHLGLEETIDLYGDKLFYTHFKNSAAVPGINKRISTSLSEGEINHRAYIIKLKETNFDGPVCIEAPRDGDRVWFAKQDFDYIKSILFRYE